MSDLDNRAYDIFEDHGARIREIDTGSLEAGRKRQEIVSEFAEEIAACVTAGLSESTKSQIAGDMAEATGGRVTKTAITNDIDEQVAQRLNENRPTTDTDRIPLDVFLMGDPDNDPHLQGIRAVRSTDAKQATSYRWRLFGPRLSETKYIETGQSAPTNHAIGEEMRDAILDVTGIWVKPPLTPNWREYAGNLVADADVVTSTGTRTNALWTLQNIVSRQVAYPDIETMIDSNGGVVVADGELWVLTADVASAAQRFDISPRALQVQIEAEGYGVDRLSGVSEKTFVHGERVGYWVLSDSFADPADTAEEPRNGRSHYEAEAEAARQDTGEKPAGEIGGVSFND